MGALARHAAYRTDPVVAAGTSRRTDPDVATPCAAGTSRRTATSRVADVDTATTVTDETSSVSAVDMDCVGRRGRGGHRWDIDRYRR
jgi:hypothetical protein